MRLNNLAALALAVTPAIAGAAETTTYSYDAKGRLVSVARAGGPNHGVVSTYAFDHADNRTSVTTSGVMPRVIVVPLGGLKVIAIPRP